MELTENERNYLFVGYPVDGEVDEFSLPEKWRDSKKELMKQWFGEGNHFKRPWAFWVLENQMEPPGEDEQKKFIIRNRLLTEFETVRFWEEQGETQRTRVVNGCNFLNFKY